MIQNCSHIGEQLLDQEEQIALEEFNKLEKRLGHEPEKKDSE